MKKRKPNSTKMSALLRSSPLSNASLSEIAGSLADLSRILREEFAKSSTQTQQQLAQSAESLTSAVECSESVLSSASERLITAKALRDEAATSHTKSQQSLNALTAAARTFWHVSRELKPALETCNARLQDDCDRRRTFETQVMTWITGFNSRLTALEKNAVRSERQYRNLCSALRRLDDCEN